MWSHLRKRLEKKTADIARASRSDFSMEKRVDLYHLLTKLFSADGEEIYAKEIYALEELVRERLHRLSLGQGDVDTQIRDFILTASEDDLLTLIESIPEAQSLAVREPGRFRHSRRYAGRMSPEEFQRTQERAIERQMNAKFLVEKVRSALNHFLENTPSPARFRLDGTFQRQAFAIETPQTLRKLPDKEVLEPDINQLLHDKEPFAVIFIDLDNFKSVNDQLGSHQAGDNCLEKVAEIVGSIVAKKGKLYRYAGNNKGDEFVAVLPNCKSEEAAPTGERIRMSIDEGNPGGKVKVTTSIGVVSSHQLQAADSKALLEAVEEAMYFSKKSGKNRITVWEPSLSLASLQQPISR